VAWSGCGIRIAGDPEPAAIRSAVQKVLDDDFYRTNARLLAAEAATYDSGTLGSELLEQLATTQAPVLRPATTT
jgi:UDP:flavonoid glycosyltransferase YjiC (YdhE family)